MSLKQKFINIQRLICFLAKVLNFNITNLTVGGKENYYFLIEKLFLI